MEAFARRPEQFRLAISLHATTSAQRRSIMPVEKKYDLEAVMRAAQAFRKRVTLEYVMIGGVNDANADADRLARLARRLGALVNILPLHPGGAPDLNPTPADRIRGFAGRLRNQGVEATVRRSRGLDIGAACGQLSEVGELRPYSYPVAPNPAAIQLIDRSSAESCSSWVRSPPDSRNRRSSSICCREIWFIVPIRRASRRRNRGTARSAPRRR